jgi:hypothetical protein
LHHLEASIVNAFCLAVDFVSAIVIVGYCVAAFVTGVYSRSPTQPHNLVARGALLGMSMKLVGACVKTIQLQTWNQIGLFLAILALRMILKRSFVMEKMFKNGTEIRRGICG